MVKKTTGSQNRHVFRAVLEMGQFADFPRVKAKFPGNEIHRLRRSVFARELIIACKFILPESDFLPLLVCVCISIRVRTPCSR